MYSFVFFFNESKLSLSYKNDLSTVFLLRRWKIEMKMQVQLVASWNIGTN